MTDTKELEQETDTLGSFTRALIGADRVVVETENALGCMDASYRPAKPLADAIQTLATDNARLEARVRELEERRNAAYGFLWHAPVDVETPSGRASLRARGTLLSTMTKEDQRQGIECTRDAALSQEKGT